MPSAKAMVLLCFVPMSFQTTATTSLRRPQQLSSMQQQQQQYDSSSWQEEIQRLKDEIHLLDVQEASRRLRRISLSSPPPHQDKIKHMVVLFMENRPHDHFFGCMDLPGADGIPASGRLIPRHPAYPERNGSAGFVNVTCGTAKYICDKPPAYSTWDSKFAPDAP